MSVKINLLAVFVLLSTFSWYHTCGLEITGFNDGKSLPINQALQQKLINQYQYNACQSNGVTTLWTTEFYKNRAYIKTNQLIELHLYEGGNLPKDRYVQIDEVFGSKRLSVDDAINNGLLSSTDQLKLKELNQITSQQIPDVIVFVDGSVGIESKYIKALNIPSLPVTPLKSIDIQVSAAIEYGTIPVHIVSTNQRVKSMSITDAKQKNLIDESLFDLCQKYGITTVYLINNQVFVDYQTVVQNNLIPKNIQRPLSGKSYVKVNDLFGDRTITLTDAFKQNIITQSEYDSYMTIFKNDANTQLRLFPGNKVGVSPQYMQKLGYKIPIEFSTLPFITVGQDGSSNKPSGDQPLPDNGSIWNNIRIAIIPLSILNIPGNPKTISIRDAFEQKKITPYDYSMYDKYGVDQIVYIESQKIPAISVEEALRLKLVDPSILKQGVQMNSFIDLRSIFGLRSVTFEEALNDNLITDVEYKKLKTMFGVTSPEITVFPDNKLGIMTQYVVNLLKSFNVELKGDGLFVDLRTLIDSVPDSQYNQKLSIDDALSKGILTQPQYDNLKQVGIFEIFQTTYGPAMSQQDAAKLYPMLHIDADYVLVPSFNTINIDTAFSLGYITEAQYKTLKQNGIVRITMTATGPAISSQDIKKLPGFNVPGQGYIIVPVTNTLPIDKALEMGKITQPQYDYLNSLGINEVVITIDGVGVTPDDMKRIHPGIYNPLQPIIIFPSKNITPDIAVKNNLITPLEYNLLKLYGITSIKITANGPAIDIPTAIDLNIIKQNEVRPGQTIYYIFDLSKKPIGNEIPINDLLNIGNISQPQFKDLASLGINSVVNTDLGPIITPSEASRLNIFNVNATNPGILILNGVFKMTVDGFKSSPVDVVMKSVTGAENVFPSTEIDLDEAVKMDILSPEQSELIKFLGGKTIKSTIYGPAVPYKDVKSKIDDNLVEPRTKLIVILNIIDKPTTITTTTVSPITNKPSPGSKTFWANIQLISIPISILSFPNTPRMISIKDAFAEKKITPYDYFMYKKYGIDQIGFIDSKQMPVIQVKEALRLKLVDDKILNEGVQMNYFIDLRSIFGVRTVTFKEALKENLITEIDYKKLKGLFGTTSPEIIVYSDGKLGILTQDVVNLLKSFNVEIKGQSLVIDLKSFLDSVPEPKVNKNISLVDASINQILTPIQIVNLKQAGINEIIDTSYGPAITRQDAQKLYPMTYINSDYILVPSFQKIDIKYAYDQGYITDKQYKILQINGIKNITLTATGPAISTKDYIKLPGLIIPGNGYIIIPSTYTLGIDKALEIGKITDDEYKYLSSLGIQEIVITIDGVGVKPGDMVYIHPGVYNPLQPVIIFPTNGISINTAVVNGLISPSVYNLLKLYNITYIVMTPKGPAVDIQTAIDLKLIDSDQAQPNQMYYYISDLAHKPIGDEVSVNVLLDGGKISEPLFNDLASLGIKSVVDTQLGPVLPCDKAIKIPVLKNIVPNDNGIFTLPGVFKMTVDGFTPSEIVVKGVTDVDTVLPSTKVDIDQALKLKILSPEQYKLMKFLGINSIQNTIYGPAVRYNEIQTHIDSKLVEPGTKLIVIFDIIPELNEKTPVNEAFASGKINKNDVIYLQMLGVDSIVVRPEGPAIPLDEAKRINLVNGFKVIDGFVILKPDTDSILLDIITAMDQQKINNDELSKLFNYDIKWVEIKGNEVYISLLEAFRSHLITKDQFIKLSKNSTTISINVIPSNPSTQVISNIDKSNLPFYITNLINRYGIKEVILINDNNYKISLDDALRSKVISEDDYQKYKTSDNILDAKHISLDILANQPVSLQDALLNQWITDNEKRTYEEQNIDSVTRFSLPLKQVNLTIDNGYNGNYITLPMYQKLKSQNKKYINVHVVFSDIKTLPKETVTEKYNLTPDQLQFAFKGLDTITTVVVDKNGKSFVVTPDEAYGLGIINLGQYQAFLRQRLSYIVVVIPVSTPKPEQYQTLTVQQAYDTSKISRKQHDYLQFLNVVQVTILPQGPAISLQQRTDYKLIPSDSQIIEDKWVLLNPPKDWKKIPVITAKEQGLLTETEARFLLDYDVKWIIKDGNNLFVYLIDAITYKLLPSDKFDQVKNTGAVKISDITIKQPKIETIPIESAIKNNKIPEEIYNKLNKVGISDVVLVDDIVFKITIDAALKAGLISQQEYDNYKNHNVKFLPQNIIDIRGFEIDKALNENWISKVEYDDYKKRGIKLVTKTALPLNVRKISIDDAYSFGLIPDFEYLRLKTANIYFIDVNRIVSYPLVLPRNDAIKFEYINDNELPNYLDINVVVITKLGKKMTLSPLQALYLGLITLDQYQGYINHNIATIVVYIPPSAYFDVITTTAPSIITPNPNDYNAVTIEALFEREIITERQYLYFKNSGVLTVLYGPEGIKVSVDDLVKMKFITPEQSQDYKNRHITHVLLKDIVVFDLTVAYEFGKISNKIYTLYQKAGVQEIIIDANGNLFLSPAESLRLNLITDVKYKELIEKQIDRLDASLVTAKIFPLESALDYKIITPEQMKQMEQDNIFGISRTGVTYKLIEVTVQNALYNGYITKEIADSLTKNNIEYVLVYQPSSETTKHRNMFTLDVGDAIKQDYLNIYLQNKYFTGQRNVNVLVLNENGKRNVMNVEVAFKEGILTKEEYNQLVANKVEYIIVYSNADFDHPDSTSQFVLPKLPIFVGDITLHFYVTEPLEMDSTKVTIDDLFNIYKVLTLEQFELLKRLHIETIYVTHKLSMIDERHDVRYTTLIDALVSNIIDVNLFEQHFKSDGTILVKYTVDTKRPQDGVKFTVIGLHQAYALGFISDERFEQLKNDQVTIVYLIIEFVPKYTVVEYTRQDARKILSKDDMHTLDVNDVSKVLVVTSVILENQDYNLYTNITMDYALIHNFITPDEKSKYSQYLYLFTNIPTTGKNIYMLDQAYQKRLITEPVFVDNIKGRVENAQIELKVVGEKTFELSKSVYKELSLEAALNLVLITNSEFARYQSLNINTVFVVYMITDTIKYKEPAKRDIKPQAAFDMQIIDQEHLDLYTKQKVDTLPFSMTIAFDVSQDVIQQDKRFTYQNVPLEIAQRLKFLTDVEVKALKDQKISSVYLKYKLKTIWKYEKPDIALNQGQITSDEFNTIVNVRKRVILKYYEEIYMKAKPIVRPNDKLGVSEFYSTIETTCDQAWNDNLLLQSQYDKCDRNRKIWKLWMAKEVTDKRLHMSIDEALELGYLDQSGYDDLKQKNVKFIWVQNITA